MQKLLVLLSAFFIFSCGNDTDKLTVKGNIKGLKKGTVYLKKANDTTLVTLDSLIINGNPQFELSSAIESPEMFYLYLNKNDSKEDRISFFGDKGVTEINTTLKNFVLDAEINGSKQQDVLEKYLLMMAKFNDKNLELIKENLDAKIANDSALITKTENTYNSLIKRKYLYTVNFAINNKDSEVAPYLALTEIFDANIKLLDTINNSLTPEIKSSLYGKELQEFIEKIKIEEAE